MTDQKERIEEIIRNGYDFKFGDYISRGFEIVQKELGQFILFTVVFFAISFVCQIIPLIGPLANSFILQPALLAGLAIAAHHVYKGQRIEFSTFFKGFDHLGNLALVTLVMMLIFVAAMIPFLLTAWSSGFFGWLMATIEDPTGMQGEFPPFTPLMIGVLALSMFLFIYLAIAYSWANMFVVFYKMSFWDALETSRRLINRQWFMFFLFLIVVGIITVLGVLLLCVGLLFTIPAGYCMQYAAFEDITQLNREPDEDAMLEKHLIVD